jgi:hypothetical protein
MNKIMASKKKQNQLEPIRSQPDSRSRTRFAEVCYADSESAEELIGEGKRLEADVVFRVRRRQVLTYPK